MELSVIIVNYNSSNFLELTLLSVYSSLKKSSISAEVIVVDNYSTDNSCNMIKKKFNDCILIENKSNFGFARSNNIGVNTASGKYICILNPDTVVSENTFTDLINYYKNNLNIGIVGCQMLNGNGVFLKESKRNLPSLISSIFKLLGITKLYYSNVDKDSYGKVDVLAGAFMFMEKKKYDIINGFDEDYFMYGEDIDLSLKSLKKGYNNHYLGSLKIIHFKGESTTKDFIYFKRFYEAMYIYYTKHFNKYILSKYIAFLLYKFTVLTKQIASLFTNFSNQNSLSINNKYFVTRMKTIDNGLDAQLLSFDNYIGMNIVNSLLIFDCSTLSFQEIISSFENSSNSNSLRIYISQSNFYIGSDNSYLKGEIIKI